MGRGGWRWAVARHQVRRTAPAAGAVGEQSQGQARTKPRTRGMLSTVPLLFLYCSSTAGRVLLLLLPPIIALGILGIAPRALLRRMASMKKWSPVIWTTL